MFKFLRGLFKLWARPSQNEPDLSQYGMGEPHVRPEDEVEGPGGYGGPCIPDTDLPASIPRIAGTPTGILLGRQSLNYPTRYGDPGDLART